MKYHEIENSCDNCYFYNKKLFGISVCEYYPKVFHYTALERCKLKHWKPNDKMRLKLIKEMENK